MKQHNNQNFTRDEELVVPCEVYSRVVGYFRPVQNWNRGKQQEFKERSSFDICKKKYNRSSCGC